MTKIKYYFEEGNLFNPQNIRSLVGLAGLYFIYNEEININYPFGACRLIYIGMSERKTNSIGKRLQGHFEGTSGNVGISNYRKVNKLLFTHLNFEMLSRNWPIGIEPLESYFITSFVDRYGVYPICNNKSGYDFTLNKAPIELEIDWAFFEE